LLQAKLNDARARQKTILLRTKATESRVNVNTKLKSHAIDSALDKFEYFERKIDQMEGQLESGHVAQRGLENEFEELERQEQIDAELAELKAKMAKAAKPSSEDGAA
jgi:phage shock protein A